MASQAEPQPGRDHQDEQAEGLGNAPNARRTAPIGTTRGTRNTSKARATRITTMLMALFAAAATFAILFAPQTAHASLQSDYDEANAAYETLSAERVEIQLTIDELEALAAEQEDIIASLPDALGELAGETNIESESNHLGIVRIFGNPTKPITIDTTLAPEDALAKFREELARIKPTIASEKAFAQCELSGIDALRKSYGYRLTKLDADLAKSESARNVAKEAFDDYKASHGTYPGFSGSVTDEESARAYIMMKESGGSYTATNGRYYGAYQLDCSYLNGDFSPANQDATAERYVKGRYGSWMGAYRFWVGHSWY